MAKEKQAGGFPVGTLLLFLVIGAALAWLASSVLIRRLQPPELLLDSYGVLDPDWKVQTLDGNEVAVSDMKGKPIFINIWATWCGPCVMEMPSVNALHRSLKDKVNFLVVSQEPGGEVAAARDKHGWTLPLYTAGDLPAALQTNGIPATFIVNKKGEIVFQHIGAANWDTQEVRDFLLK